MSNFTMFVLDEHDEAVRIGDYPTWHRWLEESECEMWRSEFHSPTQRVLVVTRFQGFDPHEVLARHPAAETPRPFITMAFIPDGANPHGWTPTLVARSQTRLEADRTHRSTLASHGAPVRK